MFAAAGVAMRALLVLVMVLPLAGCVTNQERIARMNAQYKQQQAALAAADRESCTKYGFAPGTPDYSRCLMQLDQNRKAEGAAETAAITANQAAAANAMMATSQQMIRDSFRVPQTTHCMPSGIGVSCTSY